MALGSRVSTPHGPRQVSKRHDRHPTGLLSEPEQELVLNTDASYMDFERSLNSASLVRHVLQHCWAKEPHLARRLVLFCRETSSPMISTGLRVPTSMAGLMLSPILVMGTYTGHTAQLIRRNIPSSCCRCRLMRTGSETTACRSQATGAVARQA